MTSPSTVGIVPEPGASANLVPDNLTLQAIDPATLAGAKRLLDVSAQALREFCTRYGFDTSNIRDGQTYTVDVFPPPGPGGLIRLEVESAPGAALAGSTEPDWLRGADAEERRELEDLGMFAAIDQEADRDALASTVLRAIHEHEQDLGRYTAALAQETQALVARYDRLMAPARRQIERLRRFLAPVVAAATFAGKKKSRSVGWGSFGRRKHPDRIEVHDEPAALAWLESTRPDLVNVDVTFTLEEAKDLLIRSAALVLAARAGGLSDVASVMDVPGFVRLHNAVGAHDFGYSKSEIKKLVTGPGYKVVEIPGVRVVTGADEPWFEVEPPAGA